MEEVKRCPICGTPMRREEDRRVCPNCGYEEPIIEFVAHPSHTQDDEYIQPSSYSKRPTTTIAYAQQKSLKRARDHAYQIVTRLGLQDQEAKAIVEEAMNIYKQAAERDIVKGRSVNAMIEGAIYAVIKKRNLPINLDRLAATIAEIRKTEKTNMNKDIRQLKKQVKSEILKNYNLLRSKIGGKYFAHNATIPPYIDRYAEELKVSDEVKRLAQEIFQVAKEKRLTVGRNPSGIAAAAIYVAAKILRRRDIQQRKVARQAGITEVTLRNRSRELERVICNNIEELERRFSEALGFDVDLRRYCEQAIRRKKKRIFNKSILLTFLCERAFYLYGF